MVPPSSKFYSKIQVGFCLNTGKCFLCFPTERAQILLKSCTRDFQNSPPVERSDCFYVTISENFKRFQYFIFKTDFLEYETLFKKLEYHFLVESTKIENASFPYKTAISEANDKTNKMVTTKWTYHKERSFASNYFVFLKKFFQFNNLL